MSPNAPRIYCLINARSCWPSIITCSSCTLCFKLIVLLSISHRHSVIYQSLPSAHQTQWECAYMHHMHGAWLKIPKLIRQYCISYPIVSIDHHYWATLLLTHIAFYFNVLGVAPCCTSSLAACITAPSDPTDQRLRGEKDASFHDSSQQLDVPHLQLISYNITQWM